MPEELRAWSHGGAAAASSVSSWRLCSWVGVSLSTWMAFVHAVGDELSTLDVAVGTPLSLFLPGMAEARVW